MEHQPRKYVIVLMKKSFNSLVRPEVTTTISAIIIANTITAIANTITAIARTITAIASTITAIASTITANIQNRTTTTNW